MPSLDSPASHSSIALSTFAPKVKSASAPVLVIVISFMASGLSLVRFDELLQHPLDQVRERAVFAGCDPFEIGAKFGLKPERYCVAFCHGDIVAQRRQNGKF